KEQGCLEGLMICPVGRDVIYCGKALVILLFMLIIEAISLLIFTFLFNLSLLSPELIVVTILTTVGFAAVGTLFSAISINTKARELVLPILFLPIVVPVVISAVKATGLVLSGESWSGILSWLQIIACFDAIFIVVAILVSPFVIEE
ncbi:MAG: heme exporter protein CcmB, partial [Candidatus Margulisiibacteriota bacterium]